MERTIRNPSGPTPEGRPYQEEGLVLAGVVRNLLGLADHFGLTRDTLISAAGASAEDLADPNSMVPVSVLESLLMAVHKRTGDDLLGLHFSEHTRPESFGVAGYIVRACSSLRELIEMCIRYEHLVSTIGKTSLEFKPGLVAWTWDLTIINPTFRWLAVDFMLGVLASSREHLPATKSSQLESVLIQHSAPKALQQRSEYERVFGCQVHFGQSVNALVFPRAILDTPLKDANADMREALESHARVIEQRQAPPDFLTRARSILRTMVTIGKPSRLELARVMGMSDRHLLRRLRGEGTTYRALVNELRQEMAERLLLESNESIEEIAHRLKYSESQSFIRWFRIWKGTTPSQFRQETNHRSKRLR